MKTPKKPAKKKKSNIVGFSGNAKQPHVITSYEVQPGMVQLPLAKVLALVFNIMDPEADKTVALETLAEYTGQLSQKDVDDFVMGTVRKLPGYNLRDGLRIAEALTKWQDKYFDNDSFDDDESYN